MASWRIALPDMKTDHRALRRRPLPTVWTIRICASVTMWVSVDT